MAYPEKLVKSWRVRYEKPDGTTGSKSGFPTKSAALHWGREQERLIREGTWTDPDLAETPWTQWWEDWFAGIEVEEGTADFYESLWTTHIQPRWGSTQLGKTRGTEVMTWLRQLRDGKVETGPAGRRRTRAYSARTVDGIRKLMKLMLDDAILAKLIQTNVLRTEVPQRNRGKRAARIQKKTIRPKLHATPEDVLAIAVNMGEIAGPGAFVRVLIAGWTGIRPGESAALLRQNCHEGTPPKIVVDDEEGALKQTRASGITRGTPKGGIGREVTLSPSPSALLNAWLAYNPLPEVFPPPPQRAVKRTADAPVKQPATTWTRDSWKDRWRTACDGKPEKVRQGGYAYVETGRWVIPQVLRDFEFKGLRRGHNVWLTEAGVAEVARAHRLGHAMGDDMQQAYSLVSTILEDQVHVALEACWWQAFAGPSGPAALEIISRFSPDLAEQWRRALSDMLGEGPSPAA